MAKGLNLCQFIGHVGKTPETAYTQSGIAYSNFSVAINESWKSEDGEKHEKTEWINVVAWRKLAEVVGKFVTKGMLVYVSGKMTTEKYEKDGVTKYATKIVANEVQFLSSKDGVNGNNGGDSNDWYEKEAAKAEAAKQTAPATSSKVPVDSELPF